MNKPKITQLVKTIVGAISPRIGNLLDGLQISEKAKTEMKAELLKLQSDQMLQEMEHEISTLGLEVDDRKDAREMQKATRNWFVNALSGAIVLAYLGFITILIFRIPAIDSNLLTVMMHPIAMALGAVLAFYFGGSSSSDAQSKMKGFAQAMHEKNTL